MARPAAPFALTPSDLVTLQSWLRMGSLAQNLAQRARILLLLADGLTPNTVAEQMQVSASVIFKWRKRYQEAGLEGLNDLPRSGQPRKLSAAKFNDILTLTTQRVHGDLPDHPRALAADQHRGFIGERSSITVGVAGRDVGEPPDST